MFGIQGYIIGGMALVMLAAGGIGYWYYKDSQAELQAMAGAKAALEQQKIILEGKIEGQKAVISRMQINFDNQIRANKDLQKRLQSAESEQDRLAKLLSKHDLRYLSYRKPGLIERRKNDATERKRKELENATK